MSSDLEARLVRAFARVAPTPEETERVRARVLGATTPFPRRRRVHVLGGGVLAAVIAAGVGMAAAGRLVPGTHAPTAKTPTLATPVRPAAVVLTDGHAWVTRASGARISRPASAVELSPAALFVAFGERGALVAAELDGDVRWRVEVRGEVVQIAWAPYPTYIAYVVRSAGRHDLRVIWANGRHDRLVARDVAAARPRWRLDTGALDYADADGRDWTWEREPDRLRPRGPRGATG